MKNYHLTLVSLLNNILPTYYEMQLSRECEVPCISYMEMSNSVSQGDTFDGVGDVANVTYQIKVWGTDISVINANAQLIDETLKPRGWKRISCAEMADSNSAMIQKIMLYNITSND